jgi:lysophospholipid acyltransferase (LPLAT)-like uncharacterized protein
VFEEGRLMPENLSEPGPAPDKVAKSGLVIPQRAKWHGRLAAAAIFGLTKGFSATLRYHWRDESGVFNGGIPEPVIFCLWHNRLALCLNLYHDYMQRRQPSRRLAAMVSASKDGGLLARVLEHYGVRPVRGSSSRRGPQALLEMTSNAENGLDLGITPDGPRGPCYEVQPGVIAVAQLTGRPIIPVSYRLAWKYRLNSWDRFQIPLPFSRCDVRLGRAIRVPREATEEERDQFREELENVMRAITED